jgi:hypothetical protein
MKMVGFPPKSGQKNVLVEVPAEFSREGKGSGVKMDGWPAARCSLAGIPKESR